ncbi:hypothetical protein NQZ68_015936 [Dissostichus eleginoides]|nr:hypothetical protein NQZ68_015936 [Dissostichus eleginoides]
MQLDCMLSVCKDYILEEVKHANYLAIQADETTDISTHWQLVLVLRYINLHNNVKEHFFEFIPLQSANADPVASALRERLGTILPDGQQGKRITQAYDGAAVSQLKVEFSGKIMPCVDMLFNQLQKRNIDSLYIIQRFTSSIQTIRDSIPSGEISGSVQQPPTKNGGHLDMKSNSGWLERVQPAGLNRALRMYPLRSGTSAPGQGIQGKFSQGCC